ncbi:MULTISPECIES: gamma-glutamyltransferase family protein [Burkholderia]|uniref:Gamma-glutamyltranspeptidase family protein n=1 Tax=Burkholderia cepacia TaxID=292 RepID=A0AA88Z370_BURCE|nr:MULTISPECIES: gamma-glutamyltransferase [Burkholderia]KGB93993.1 gamma-glutamyltranspeptidase family protein [Burkholderia cepacia]KWE59350.1 gamma-glutamyltransferase [Burkholderia sp. MSMB2157WGS]
MSHFENWQIRKPAISASGGIVVSQHYKASKIGAAVLEDGGNAIDAAIAASFAIGVLEPWQSGLGGVGHMVVSPADGTAFSIDFAARAPLALEAEDYRLTGEPARGMFGWPAVIDDRNLEGPFSIGVPGQVAGMTLAHREFGSLPWRRLLEPAVRCAREGLEVDWYLTLKIASAAAGLARYPASSACYLRDGHAPASDWSGAASPILLEDQAATLELLAERGGDDFYRGELARRIAVGFATVGSRLSRDDLAAYRAEIAPIEALHYRDADILTSSALTAGPALARALSLFAGQSAVDGVTCPDARFFSRIADALTQTYAERIDGTAPAADARRGTCTTHISVVDRHGNAVALTQTLLSMFGSKVTLPHTGIVMNNAIMWFDPRPGKANSIKPGAVPLSNMCPTVIKRATGDVLALGASGGRRIMPAVMQLISYLIDCGMSIEDAIHFPRLDVSGDPWVTLDERLDASVSHAIGATREVRHAANLIAPNLFGCPNVVLRDAGTRQLTGGAFVSSPWSAAVAERDAR